MKRFARVIVGVALLGFLSGVGSHFSFWETTMFSRRQNTVEYRKVNLLTSLAMIKANPIFGIGFGNYRSMWPQYFQPVEGIDLRELDDGNHNTFLGLFAETGLVGFLSYLIIFYYMLRVGLQVYRKGEQFEREFALVFLLVMIVFIFGGNFSDYRSERFLNATLFLLFGTVAGIKVHRASVTPRSVAAFCRLCRLHSPRWPLVDAPQDVGVRAGPFSQGRKCFCLAQRDKWGGRRHGRGR
jgi:O-antigen ligase